MKTKFYLSALALTAAFASCSQEELVSEAINNQTDLNNRPVVGQVTFTGDAESRYNFEAGDFEVNKDVLGLYLMDEYQGSYDGTYTSKNVCPGEHKDANTTLWKYQDHWWAMYQLVNYANSNYPFRYVTENGENVWKNDAKLVEGNYFAMYPQNDKILNRREVWHYINPSVTMDTHSTKDGYYLGVENQLFLGYKQIYRDDTKDYDEGVLKVDLSLKGVMAGLRIKLLGWQGNDVRLDKISFRDANGKALPTIAYVEPATENNWVKADDSWYEKFPCSNEKHGIGLYGEEEEKATWTKKTIRTLVNWRTTENGRIPYGLEEEKQGLAYEYSFAFPENTIIKGDVADGDVVWAYICLPALTEDQWKDIQPVIYGWKKIKDDRNSYHWEYGLLQDKENPNVSFEFGADVTPWTGSDESNYYQLVEARFDNMTWKAVNEIPATATDDMVKMVEAWLTENPGSSDATLTVMPDQAGIEVTTEFVDYLKEASEEYDRNITIHFAATRNGKVVFNDDETMAVYKETTEAGKKVTFKYDQGLTLINNATQTVPANGYNGLATAIVNNNGKLIVEGEVFQINNENETIVYGKAVNVHNNKKFTLKNDAVVVNVENKGEMIVDAYVAWNDRTAYVGVLNNHLYTANCVQCLAEVNVETGTLNVENALVNDGEFYVNLSAALNIEVEAINNTHKDSNGVERTYITNDGTIYGKFIKNLGGIINNGLIGSSEEDQPQMEKITNEGGAKIDNYGSITPSDVINNQEAGEINAYGTSVITNLYQKGNGTAYGKLNVYSAGVDVQSKDSSWGEIYIYGVAAEHVATTSGYDKRYYVVNTEEDTKLTDLYSKLAKTTAYNVVFDSSAEVVFNIDDVQESVLLKAQRTLVNSITVNANKTVTFKGDVDDAVNRMTNLENATLIINGVLNIQNALTIKVKSVDEEATGKIHVATGSALNVGDNTGGDIIHGW